MAALICDFGNGLYVVRMTRQPSQYVPRVVRPKPVLPLFDAGHDRRNVVSDMSHRSLPTKG